MKIKNPIIRGFYPDPSVCAANGRYYMACSSFEYFPGVPLFESEDLLNWRQIGHCLTRSSQVDLKGIESSGGVFAPTIRYNGGRFYMVTTNDTYHKNFYVYTDDIYGEWSEPVFVDQGGIDPSLFFEGGRAYFMSNGTDEADGRGCIFQCEIDIDTGERLTESKPVWKGSGGRYLESPHLYRFGDFYYIMAAEGGTEYGHMITYARAKTPYGPFKNYKKNPVLTNRNLGGHQSRIQGIGHGDLVEDDKGRVFMFCLGFRQIGTWQPYHNLGREVFLVPVRWDGDGWFLAGEDGVVKKEMEADVDAARPPAKNIYDASFEALGADSPRWCHLREYKKENFEFRKDGVRLKGTSDDLFGTGAPTFLGVRQSEFYTELEVKVKSGAAEAGITFYLSEKHHYDLFVSNKDGKRTVNFRIRIGDAVQTVKQIDAPGGGQVALFASTDNEKYDFFVSLDGGDKIGMGSAGAKYLSSEVAGGFTGTVMAMYVVDGRGGAADFSGLSFIQRDKES